jgi:hypothetical protein
MAPDSEISSGDPVEAEEVDAPYKADPRLCLVLTVELDIAASPHIHSLDQTVHDDATKVVTETIGAIHMGDLKVERVDSNEKLDFDAVHSMEISQSWFTHPVVVQFVYTPNETKLFGRVTVCLQDYDGVSGLHTVFSVLEYFEHKDSGASPETYLTKPDFKASNIEVDFDPDKMGAHENMLQSLETNKGDGTRLPVGPLRVEQEDSLKPRIWKRFSSTKTTFKDFIRVSSECQKRLELPYVAYTVNYAPSVCLGRVPAIKDTLDREKRFDGVFTPKGAPLPMNLDHAAGLSYMLFWNNYGKHNPNISARVTAAVWNWTGLSKCFTPMMWAIEINGKPFFVSSFSSGDWPAVEDLVTSVDGGIPLTECPQPIPLHSRVVYQFNK